MSPFIHVESPAGNKSQGGLAQV